MIDDNGNWQKYSDITRLEQVGDDLKISWYDSKAREGRFVVLQPTFYTYNKKEQVAPKEGEPKGVEAFQKENVTKIEETPHSYKYIIDKYDSYWEFTDEFNKSDLTNKPKEEVMKGWKIKEEHNTRCNVVGTDFVCDGGQIISNNILGEKQPEIIIEPDPDNKEIKYYNFTGDKIKVDPTVTINQTVGASLIIDDSYVSSGSPSTNYGDSTSWIIRAGGTTQEAYVEINFSSILDIIQIFNFTLYVRQTATTNTVGRYVDCNDTFDESTITYNNRATEIINCVTDYKTFDTTANGWKHLNFTQEAKDRLSRDSTFTAHIYTTEASTGTDYSSSEALSNKPYINMTYETIECEQNSDCNANQFCNQTQFCESDLAHAESCSDSVVYVNTETERDGACTDGDCDINYICNRKPAVPKLYNVPDFNGRLWQILNLTAIAVDPDGDIVAYDYYVGSSSGNDNYGNYTDVATIFKNATGLNVKQMYYWSARTCDNYSYCSAYNSTEDTFTRTNANPSVVSINISQYVQTGDDILGNITCTDFDSDTLTGYCQAYNGSEAYSVPVNSIVSKGVETSICTVDSSNTKKGEAWKFGFWCGDGTANSTKQNTTAITVQNTIPTANPSITQYSHNITLTATGFADVDSDAENTTMGMIKWFVNSTENTTFRNLTYINDTAYGINDNIFANISVYDGTNYSDEEKSNTITVGDSTAPNITYSNANPTHPTVSTQSTTLTINVSEENSMTYCKAEITDPNDVKTNYTMSVSGSAPLYVYTRTYVPSVVGDYYVDFYCKDGSGNELYDNINLSFTAVAGGGGSSSGGGGSTTTTTTATGNVTWTMETKQGGKTIQKSVKENQSLEVEIVFSNIGDDVNLTLSCDSEDGICSWITFEHKTIGVKKNDFKTVIVTITTPNDLLPKNNNIPYELFIDAEDKAGGTKNIKVTLNVQPFLAGIIDTLKSISSHFLENKCIFKKIAEEKEDASSLCLPRFAWALLVLVFSTLLTYIFTLFTIPSKIMRGILNAVIPSALFVLFMVI